MKKLVCILLGLALMLGLTVPVIAQSDFIVYIDGQTTNLGSSVFEQDGWHYVEVGAFFEVLEYQGARFVEDIPSGFGFPDFDSWYTTEYTVIQIGFSPPSYIAFHETDFLNVWITVDFESHIRDLRRVGLERFNDSNYFDEIPMLLRISGREYIMLEMACCVPPSRQS